MFYFTQFNRRTGPQTQGNKTLPQALLTQFNRRTGPQTQGNKTLPHALLTQFNRRLVFVGQYDD
jgi:hypothetical protein